MIQSESLDCISSYSECNALGAFLPLCYFQARIRARDAMKSALDVDETRVSSTSKPSSESEPCNSAFTRVSRYRCGSARVAAGAARARAQKSAEARSVASTLAYG